MKLLVRPNHVLFSAPEDVLSWIYDHYKFNDKQAAYDLARLNKTVKYMLQFGSWRHRFPSKEIFKKWADTKRQDLESKLVCFICSYEHVDLRVPVGLLDDLVGLLRAGHYSFEVQDEREFKLPRKDMKGFCPPLRRPQIEALRSMLQKPVGMLRMATGVGKTLVGEEIIRHYGVPSIFLVPSRPILNQTVTRFQAAFGSRNVGKIGDGKKKHSHVTVATYQSVYAGNPEDFAHYDLIVFDEAHHTPAETYFFVAENQLKNAVYRYGLTANDNDERGDGGGILIEAATGPVVYSYDAPEAIREGYLAKPTFITYEITKTQGTYIKWITNDEDERVPDGIVQSEATDEDDAHKAYKNFILGNNLLTQAVAELAVAFKNNGSSVLILIDEKEHGDKLMVLLKDHGAELVTGDTDGNTEVQKRFNARELKILIGTSTLGEGADLVPVDALINLMGGTKVKQANGRALRNDPDENGTPRKPAVLIIDFDVPASPVLHRHYEMREEVHRSCGLVHRRPLV